MAIQPAVKKILLSGGGTGGHITPLLAIAAELRQLQPEVTIISVGERGSKFAHLTQQDPNIDATLSIYAGKFRRFHGESIIKKSLDIRSNILNIRDAFYVVIGLFQALYLVRRQKPDIVFLKGGFVGVPIGLAAAFWRIPIVTHDSDAMPGLANRIVGRWATVHATGMPAEFYAYDSTKVQHVGVLVGRQYVIVDDNLQAVYRKDIGLPVTAKVLFITGGSLGSQRINTAIITFIDTLLTKYADLYVVHQVGRGNIGQYAGYTHERLQVLEFLDGMHRYSGASDVIVTRAGANTIAEFGIQSKACVIIPSPFLTGGHQLKNGEYLKQKQAAVIVDEAKVVANPEVLQASIEALLNNQPERRRLAEALQSLAVPNAAHKLATVLLNVHSK